jgi:hypothetical protein
VKHFSSLLTEQQSALWEVSNQGLDMELLQLLSSADAVLAANTHGDKQTDVLLSHIHHLRSDKALSERMKNPKILLDLCNVLSFEPIYHEKWSFIVDGYIAPSLFILHHPLTRSIHKPVRLVYPCISYKHYEVASQLVYHSNATFPSPSLHWPKRVSGKFRISCFGMYISHLQ